MIPLDSAASARCRSCGATAKLNLASAFLPLVIDPVRYCPNCGISLRTNSHEINCPNYEQCVSLGVAIRPQRGVPVYGVSKYIIKSDMGYYE
jgi:hypothetical protein